MEITLVRCFKFILSAKFDNIRAEAEVFVKDRFEIFNLIGVLVLSMTIIVYKQKFGCSITVTGFQMRSTHLSISMKLVKLVNPSDQQH
jgi:hypothetical protein